MHTATLGRKHSHLPGLFKDTKATFPSPSPRAISKVWFLFGAFKVLRASLEAKPWFQQSFRGKALPEPRASGVGVKISWGLRRGLRLDLRAAPGAFGLQGR